MPKSHADFWKEKIDRNVQRDELKHRELSDAGWTVIVIWKCEIKKRREDVITRLQKNLGDA